MLRFGLNLTGFSFVNFFARNTDNLLIGKLFGAKPLGLYSKAYGLLLLPLTQINAPIASVAIDLAQEGLIYKVLHVHVTKQ